MVVFQLQLLDLSGNRKPEFVILSWTRVAISFVFCCVLIHKLVRESPLFPRQQPTRPPRFLIRTQIADAEKQDILPHDTVAAAVAVVAADGFRLSGWLQQRLQFANFVILFVLKYEHTHQMKSKHCHQLPGSIRSRSEKQSTCEN